MPILTSTISNGNTTSPLGAHLRHVEGYDAENNLITGLDLNDYDIVFVDEDEDETIPAEQIIVSYLGGTITAQNKFEEIDETTSTINSTLTSHIEDVDIHTSLLQKIKFTSLEVPPSAWLQETDTIWSILLSDIKTLSYVTEDTLVDILYTESAKKMLEESGMTTLYVDNRDGVLYLCLLGDSFTTPSENTLINIRYYNPIII